MQFKKVLRAIFPAAVVLALGGFLAAAPENGGSRAGNSAAKLDEVRKMPKIDAHAHLLSFPDSGDDRLAAMLERRNMKWLDICTFIMEGQEDLGEQTRLARRFHQAYPEHLNWAASFPLAGWGSAGWMDSSLARIETGFAGGAVAVKIWKDFGMKLRDPDSSFVMIDDPRLAPIFKLIEQSGHSLVAHIGEPLNCWLPLDSMSCEGDRGYYRDFPQYHGYLLPWIPGYQAQVDSRDRLLAAWPRLRVVGCHLGSLESDVDALAARFERYPNFAVDLAGRLLHLQLQDRDKVRAFILRYSDRLLYGTDNYTEKSGKTLDQQIAHFEEVYDMDYRYLATADEMESPEVRPGFISRGLDLPLDVLRKIFYENACRWYPGI